LHERIFPCGLLLATGEGAGDGGHPGQKCHTDFANILANVNTTGMGNYASD
jgi:hypothetical protein